ncbi:MAG: SsrA-binding protein [Alphaproteobacteria bacterium]
MLLIKRGELWLTNCYIKKYSSSNENSDTNRDRKLLVSKKELNKILGASKKEGMTIVPIILYFNTKGLAKLTIGLAKGKKKQDKRHSIKDKEWSIKQQRLVKKPLYLNLFHFTFRYILFISPHG